MKRILIFAAVTASLVLVSCSKDISGTLPSSVRVLEGRLVFSNDEAFENHLTMLFNNQENISEYQKQMTGFTSSREAFESFMDSYSPTENLDISEHAAYVTIAERDEELYVEPAVDAELLSYVVNDEGIFQISDKVYNYTYDYVYIFGVEQLPVFYSKGIKGVQGAEVFPIKREFQFVQKTDILECFEYYDNDDRRFVGEVSKISGPAYAEVKVTTKNHKKTAGVWLRVKCGHLTQTGDVSFDKTVTGVTTSHVKSSDKSKTNESHMSNVLDWTAGTGTVFTITEAEVDHTGYCLGNNRACNNSLK